MSLPYSYVKEILEVTATGLVQDAISSPLLRQLYVTFVMGELDIKPAIASVTKQLLRHYDAGELVIVAQCVADGWVSFAALMDMGANAYVIQLYTKERYLGNRIGIECMKAVTAKYANVSLTCGSRLVGYYEKLGFRDWGFQNTEAANNDAQIAQATVSCLHTMHFGESKEAASYAMLDEDFVFLIDGVHVNAATLIAQSARKGGMQS